MVLTKVALPTPVTACATMSSMFDRAKLFMIVPRMMMSEHVLRMDLRPRASDHRPK